MAVRILPIRIPIARIRILNPAHSGHWAGLRLSYLGKVTLYVTTGNYCELDALEMAAYSSRHAKGLCNNESGGNRAEDNCFSLKIGLFLDGLTPA